MPVPSPRNSIRIARGNYADLNANAAAFGEGEFIYAIDQDRFYTSASGVLVAVGAGVVAAASIDALADVDTSTIAPGVGQVLKWDGSNWVPADDSNTDAVTSVAGKTGVVTLVKADITDFADGDYATAAQGSLADSATQPGDNISTLTNDSAFVDAAGASAAAPVQSVAGKTGVVTLVKGDVGLDQVDNTSDINKPISTATQSALDLKADLVGGVVPNSQLPSLAITEYLGTVASEAALLALTGQRGDWAIRTDTGSTWVITTDGGSTITDWTELATPADAVSSVNGFTGTVVLGASDVGAATTAQGALADSATQPGDNVSTLTNDAAYITSAGAPVQSVAGKTGAVTLVKADITDFSDADYATAAQGATADAALQPADIGVTVQAYDADNVVSDAAPTFTATVQTTERTITAGAFDLATGNHWTCGAITVPAPTNATAGTSGLIRITAGPVVWNAVFKFPGGTAPTISSFPAIIPFYVQSSSVILMGNVAEGIS